MIGIRTAVILYAILIAVCFWTLKGPARYLALVIVLGLAAKSVVHYLRERME